MRRSYLAYLIVAVLPAIAAVTGGVVATHGAVAGVRVASWAWVGTTALNAFQEDLVGAVDSLAAVAQPTPVNPEDPAWGRVADGRVVSALRPVAGGAEVIVLTGHREGDPEGSLRYAGAPIPLSPAQVAAAAGARLSLYLNGRRAQATSDSLGPDSLPRQTLVALSDASGTLTLLGPERGALVALDPRPGLPPSVAVMVGPAAPPVPAVPTALLLVAGLLFLFSCLAGWIQLGAPDRAPREKRLSILVVSLVPVLTAVGFLVQADRLFQETARTAATRDLARALAVSRVRGVTQSPAGVHDLTGFDATLVRGAEVQETTLGPPVEALAALPAPPSSFSSSGSVVTAKGPSHYVALRLSGGALIVATTPRAHGRITALRRTLLLSGGLMAAWLLVVGWMLGLGSMPGPGSTPVRATPDGGAEGLDASDGS